MLFVCYIFSVHFQVMFWFNWNFINKINQLGKNKVDVETLKENHGEFIKNNKLKVKSQQRFRSKKHNLFTEEIKGYLH